MTIYYVDNVLGNDNNDGLSEGAGGAWATLQKTFEHLYASVLAHQSNIYYVKGGSPYIEDVYIGNYTLDISADSWQYHMVVEGYINTPGDDGHFIWQRDYSQSRGITVVGGGYFGPLTIKNFDITNSTCTSGFFFCNNSGMEGATLVNMNYYNNTGPVTDGGTNGSLYGYINCNIFNNTLTSYIGRNQKYWGCKIYNNTLTNTYGNLFVADRLHNCLIYGNNYTQGGFLELSAYYQMGDITNCTIILTDSNLLHYFSDNASYNTSDEMYNNVFINFNRFINQSSDNRTTGFRMHNNIFANWRASPYSNIDYLLRNNTSGYEYNFSNQSIDGCFHNNIDVSDTHTIYDLFVDPDNDDYRPKVGGPLIDAGWGYL